MSLQTKDYSMFKKLLGNRDKSPKHAADLTQAMKLQNMLESEPITVNEKMEVVNGQHRLEAAEANDLAVFYNIVPGANIDNVRMLHAYLRPWSHKDFLNSYVAYNNPHYIKLKEFIEGYDLSIPLSVKLLMGFSIGEKSGVAMKLFKSGNFEVRDEEAALDFADKAQEYRAFVDGKTRSDDSLLMAIKQIESKIEHKEMMNKLRRIGKVIPRQLTTKDYLHEFEEIYNLKRREENRIRFY